MFHNIVVKQKKQLIIYHLDWFKKKLLWFLDELGFGVGGKTLPSSEAQGNWLETDTGANPRVGSGIISLTII